MIEKEIILIRCQPRVKYCDCSWQEVATLHSGVHREARDEQNANFEQIESKIIRLPVMEDVKTTETTHHTSQTNSVKVSVKYSLQNIWEIHCLI